jgi:hypothetical protein
MPGARFFPLVLVVLAVSGCATMKNGRYQAVDVTSTPSGAAVTVQCGASSEGLVTPATVRLSRRAQPCALTFTTAGYQSQTVTLERRVSRAFWFNLAWSPVLSLAGLLGTDDCDEPGLIYGCTSPGEAAVGGFVIGLVPAAIGMAVDAATGAMYQKVPVRVDVNLASEEASAPRLQEEPFGDSLENR